MAPAPEISKPVDPQVRVHAAMFDPLNQQSSQIDSKAVDQFDQIGKVEIVWLILWLFFQRSSDVGDHVVPSYPVISLTKFDVLIPFLMLLLDIYSSVLPFQFSMGSSISNQDPSCFKIWPGNLSCLCFFSSILLFLISPNLSLLPSSEPLSFFAETTSQLLQVFLMFSFFFAFVNACMYKTFKMTYLYLFR